jgi:hypothetical protein
MVDPQYDANKSDTERTQKAPGVDKDEISMRI